MKSSQLQSPGVFASEFQGGQFVEVLGTQGTNPLSQWKVLGAAKALQKAYDKAIKGSTWSTSSGAPIKLQAPKDEKAVLGLVQPFLVLQVSLQQGQPLSVELGIQDNAGTRRRLILSSSFTDAKVTPLHCQVPFAAVARGTWLNLVIPLAELISMLFRSVAFRSLDSLIISGSCRLRRVFTLRDAPYHTAYQSDQYTAPHPLPLPKGLEWPPELDVFTQVVDARLLQSMGVELAALVKPSSRGMDAGRTPLGPKPDSAGGSRAPTRGIATPTSKALTTRASVSDMGVGPCDVSGDGIGVGLQGASWASVVKQEPRQVLSQQQPPSRGGSRSTGQQPTGAIWNANATDGARTRSIGVQPGSPHAGQNRLGALLPDVRPGFASPAQGRPTTDSCVVTNRSRMGGPFAGRRAVSAQVVLRGGTPQEYSGITAITANAAAGVSGVALQQAHSVPVAGRRASPNARLRAMSPSRDPAMGKFEVGMAMRTSIACLDQSSGALSDLGMLLADVPRTPVSPNNRYSRRNGAGAAGPGVNIPYTIKEGEAVHNTPRGTHGSAASCQPGSAKQQQPAAASKLERVASSTGTDTAYSPSWSSTSQLAHPRQENTSTGMARVRAQSPGALSYLRPVNSAGLPGSPPGTGPCSPAAKLTPKSSSPNQGQPGSSTNNSNAQKASSASGRAGVRSPARREPSSGLITHTSHGSPVPDLEGLLQVKGGLDDSADWGPSQLLPRVSAGLIGASCMGAPVAVQLPSNCSKQGDKSGLVKPGIPLNMPLLGVSEGTVDNAGAASGMLAEADSGAPVQQGSVGSPLLHGAALPTLDLSSSHLNRSTSFARDRYSRLSSSSGTGLKPALSRTPSNNERNQPATCTATVGPVSQLTAPMADNTQELVAQTSATSAVASNIAAQVQPAGQAVAGNSMINSPAGNTRSVSPFSSGIPSASKAVSPARRPSPTRPQVSAIPSSPAGIKQSVMSPAIADTTTAAVQPQDLPSGPKAASRAGANQVVGGKPRASDGPTPSTAATAGIASPSKLVARGASPGRAGTRAPAADAPDRGTACTTHAEQVRQKVQGAAGGVRGRGGVPRPIPIPGSRVGAGSGPSSATGNAGDVTVGKPLSLSPPDVMPGGPTPRMGRTGAAAGGSGWVPSAGSKQPTGVSQTPAASTAFTRGSVASSICEVDESVNLTAFGGFGVDEDDVLASSHFRAAAEPQARAAGISATQDLQQTGIGEVTAGMGLSSLVTPAVTRVEQPVRGLQVEGLGGPVWSNTTPSMKQQQNPADVVTPQGHTVAAGGSQPAGTIGPGVLQHTFTFPQAERAGAETPHAQHGRFPADRVHDHFHADFHSSVAVGGPLRRYTVDDDTLLVSTGSLLARHHLQHGQDVDWAHVEHLMAAPVDLAAAARAFTPPVVIPSMGRFAGVGSSTASVGPQVLTVNASQELGGSCQSLQGSLQAAGQIISHSISVQERGPAGALRKPRASDSASVGKSMSTYGRGNVGVLAGSGRARTRMGAAKGSARPAQAAEEMVDLVYDPVLNCYYDHKTGNYFALKQ